MSNKGGTEMIGLIRSTDDKSKPAFKPVVNEHHFSHLITQSESQTAKIVAELKNLSKLLTENWDEEIYSTKLYQVIRSNQRVITRTTKHSVM